MVKKLLCLWAVVLLLLPGMALASGAVYDNADLFTANEVQQMEAYIGQLREDYGMDVLVLTSRDARLNDSQDYADLFYEQHASSEDGFLYFIDLRNREQTISTSGEMIDIITDHRLDEMFDAAYPGLSEGAYARAAMAVLGQLDTYLEEGREEGSFRYDVETGEPLTAPYHRMSRNALEIIAISAIISLLMCMGGAAPW